jgi:hypothetical protein
MKSPTRDKQLIGKSKSIFKIDETHFAAWNSIDANFGILPEHQYMDRKLFIYDINRLEDEISPNPSIKPKISVLDSSKQKNLEQKSVEVEGELSPITIINIGQGIPIVNRKSNEYKDKALYSRHQHATFFEKPASSGNIVTVSMNNRVERKLILRSYALDGKEISSFPIESGYKRFLKISANYIKCFAANYIGIVDMRGKKMIFETDKKTTSDYSLDTFEVEFDEEVSHSTREFRSEIHHSETPSRTEISHSEKKVTRESLDESIIENQNSVVTKTHSKLAIVYRDVFESVSLLIIENGIPVKTYSQLFPISEEVDLVTSRSGIRLAETFKIFTVPGYFIINSLHALHIVNMETASVSEVKSEKMPAEKNLESPRTFTVNNIAFTLLSDGIYRFDPIMPQSDASFTKILNFVFANNIDISYLRSKGDFQILSDGSVIFFINKYMQNADNSTTYICDQSETLYPIGNNIVESSIVDFPNQHRLLAYDVGNYLTLSQYV